MTQRIALPAKLTRPFARGLVMRGRLLKRLDQSRNARAVWIHAPSGSGKTSLVSTWIEARKLKCLWYGVDAGDADPATFFYYLGEAVKAAPRKRNDPLPYLTPEYALGLDVFVRRFFEDLFGRFPAPFVLVLDNYQETPADARLHAIMSTALAVVPAGCRIVFLSRGEAPAAFARWHADRQFQSLGRDELQFTAGEARALAKAMPYGRLQGIVALNELARGWVTGLILLLRARAEGVATPDHHDPARPVFEYFAAEVFSKTLPGTRDFLMKTAWLPHVTPALAADVTGCNTAGDLLGGLYRERLFIERRAGGDPVYEYHPLFREFLQSRAAEQFTPQEMVAIARDTARALENSGQPDAALDLYAKTADWGEAMRLMLTQVPMMMMRGRVQTVESWLALVPPAMAEKVPSLGFWAGTCRGLRDPAEGRTILEQTYVRFKAVGDREGCLMTWASISEGYFMELADVTGMDRWIDELETLLPGYTGFANDVAEARFIASTVGLMARDPSHPALNVWMERALELIGSLSDPLLRARLASATLMYLLWKGDMEGARPLAMLGLQLLADSQAPPLARLFAGNAACNTWQFADHATSRSAVEAALRISAETGIHVMDLWLHGLFVIMALSAGDTVEAERHLDIVDRLVYTMRIGRSEHAAFLRVGLLLARGNPGAAVALGARELPRVKAGGHRFMTAAYSVMFAQALMLDGRHAESRVELATVLSFAAKMQSDILRFHVLVYLAWSLFATGEDAEALQKLREAFAVGARRNYMNCHPWWIPHVMSCLCARALEAGIETQYVCRLIRIRGLLPDKHYMESWPWPIRVYTLGRFDLMISDATATAVGKAQKKPLELLKALIAHGGSDVGSGILTEALWPDSEGDARESALTSTLHRLRKLLGRDDAILLHDNKLTLNPHVAWVDVWAFERLLGKPAGASADQVFDLYQGHFLEREGDQPWMLATRDKLRSRFLRHITALGRRHETNGDWERAAELYQRGLEHDNLAEDLYRRLMVTYWERGQRAGAIEAYRRCRHMLSVVLGVKPSAETEQLYQTMKGA